MKAIALSLFIPFFFALSCALVEAQNENSETIQLIYSEVLDGRETPSGMLRIYSGSVKFKRGDAIVEADTVYHYLDLNNAELFGNVRITQNDMILKSEHIDYNGNSGLAKSYEKVTIIDSSYTLKADKGSYSTDSHIARFRGDVSIKDKQSLINSDFMIYDRDTYLAKAFGNVSAEDDSSLMYCDTLYYNRETRRSESYGSTYVKDKINGAYLVSGATINEPDSSYGESYDSPVLFKIDTVAASEEDSAAASGFQYDTLSVACDTIKSYRGKSEKYVFINDVEISRKNVRAKADRAIFYRDRNLIFLLGSPIVWYDSTQLSSDSILIYFEDDKINRISSLSAAFAVSKDDSLDAQKKHQLSGKEIEIFIENDAISRIESYIDAKSLYFMDAKNGEGGAARNAADTIKIIFENESPSEIIWLGAVEGKYFPENLIYDSVKEYYLPDFRWEAEKPRKRYLNFPDKRK